MQSNARVDRTNMGITDVCRMALGSQGPNLRITEVCRVVPASRARWGTHGAGGEEERARG